jgi:hypothetical protein
MCGDDLFWEDAEEKGGAVDCDKLSFASKRLQTLSCSIKGSNLMVCGVDVVQLDAFAALRLCSC